MEGRLLLNHVQGRQFREHETFVGKRHHKLHRIYQHFCTNLRMIYNFKEHIFVKLHSVVNSAVSHLFSVAGDQNRLILNLILVY